jgi:transketolase
VGDFSAENRQGKNIAFGVREFPMSAITNGLALYGGLIPFDATFLAFSDYSRAALRLGSLQQARVIHEFTHDSFYLGEDGPTHQPIEHLMSLRAIPDLYVMRPSDAEETELLTRKALNLQAPSCLCLTRQKLSNLNYPNKSLAGRGAWVLKDPAECKIIIFATGSEVQLALQVSEQLEKDKDLLHKVKVVAVPCWKLFFQQDLKYQAQVMTTKCKTRISIEAGSTLGWERFVGMDGLKIGIDHFGSSAPYQVLENKFGFTVESILDRMKTNF